MNDSHKYLNSPCVLSHVTASEVGGTGALSGECHCGGCFNRAIWYCINSISFISQNGLKMVKQDRCLTIASEKKIQHNTLTTVIHNQWICASKMKKPCFFLRKKKSSFMLLGQSVFFTSINVVHGLNHAAIFSMYFTAGAVYVSAHLFWQSHLLCAGTLASSLSPPSALLSLTEYSDEEGQKCWSVSAHNPLLFSNSSHLFFSQTNTHAPRFTSKLPPEDLC